MAFQGGSFFERRGMAWVMRRLSGLAADAPERPADELRAAARDLQRLRGQIDLAAGATEAALIARAGTEGIELPEQCDWAFRPAPWSEPIRPAGATAVGSPAALAGGVSLFHDCPASEVCYRQARNGRRDSGAPFAIILEVYRFGGSFLSMVQDLPDPALKGLTRDHFMNVSLSLNLERPLEIYARLNIQHGPNTEQIVRQFEINGVRAVAEFDLAYTRINERRLEKMWLDLIFEGPEMNRVAIWDMTLTRAPRADL